jgi:hypothetical protein
MEPQGATARRSVPAPSRCMGGAGPVWRCHCGDVWRALLTLYAAGQRYAAVQPARPARLRVQAGRLRLRRDPQGTLAREIEIDVEMVTPVRTLAWTQGAGCDPQGTLAREPVHGALARRVCLLSSALPVCRTVCCRVERLCCQRRRVARCSTWQVPAMSPRAMDAGLRFVACVTLTRTPLWPVALPCFYLSRTARICLTSIAHLVATRAGA